MKNIFCLFERPFTIQKNGVFLFEISFIVLEILTFFYYANQISDDVILFAKAVFLKLGTIIVHHKRNTMTPLMSLPWQQFGHWCCLNKIKIPSFCLKPRTIYPTRSIDGSSDNMGAVSAPSSTLFLISAVANGDICFLDRKRLEPKELLWQHH